MTGEFLRRWTMAACVAGGFLSAPSESRAICGCFRDCWERMFGTSQYPATAALPTPYTPLASGGCGSVCPPRYVAQTQYRTEYVSVPVTTMRPYTVCDPCSGCPVTCMRPVTTMMQQPRLVPYTTYRPVQPICPTPVCAAVPVSTAFYAPATAAPSCCGAAPRSPYYNPAPSGAAPLAPPAFPGIPRANPSPLPPTGQPQLPAAAGTTSARPLNEPARIFPEAPSASLAAPKTFAEKTPPLDVLKPIPDRNAGQPFAPAPSGPAANAPATSAPTTPATSEPRLVDPHNRTTAGPRSHTAIYRPAGQHVPNQATPAPARGTDDEWRPSRR